MQELQPCQDSVESLQQQLQGLQELAQQVPVLLDRLHLVEAQLAARRNDDFFTTAEVNSFLFDLEPTEIQMWAHIHFLPAVRAKHFLAHEITQYSDEKWRDAKHLPECVSATQWLARAIKAALQRDKPYVKRFYNMLLEQRDIVMCGRTLMLTILGIPVFEVGPEQTTFANNLETHVYFTEGMSVVDAKLAASQLKKDFELLAQRGVVGNSPITLLTKLIDKMPASLQKMADDFKTDIFKAQTLGKDVYTYDQLSALIAGIVNQAPVPQANGAFKGVSKCNICGKDHHTTACKDKCPECKNQCCPGARGEECVVCADEVPSNVKGFNGRVLQDFLQKCLVKSHAEYHKSDGGNGGPAAHTSLLASAVASDALTGAVSTNNALHEGPKLHAP